MYTFPKLPTKRSREHICDHGWDVSDNSLLSFISQDFPFQETVSNIPIINSHQQPIPKPPSDSVVLKSTEREEIYTSISLDESLSECSMCQDCKACEGKGAIARSIKNARILKEDKYKESSTASEIEKLPC